MTQNNDFQDDLDWFDGLSGGAETGQGALLRQQLAEIERAEAEQSDLTHDWQRLQFAMRRERVNGGWNFFAMAASVLIFFSAVYMLRPVGEMPSEQDMMRGSSEQLIVSAQAAQDANQLQARLNQLGVIVFRQSTATKVSLRIQLVYPVPQSVGDLLASHAIALPDAGELTVTFLQPAQ